MLASHEKLKCGDELTLRFHECGSLKKHLNVPFVCLFLYLLFFSIENKITLAFDHRFPVFFVY